MSQAFVGNRIFIQYELLKNGKTLYVLQSISREFCTRKPEPPHTS